MSKASLVSCFLCLLGGCAVPVGVVPSNVDAAMGWYAEPTDIEGPQYAGCTYEEHSDGALTAIGVYDERGHLVSRRDCFVDGRPIAEAQRGYDIDRLVWSAWLLDMEGDGFRLESSTSYGWEDGRRVSSRDNRGTWEERWFYDASGHLQIQEHHTEEDLTVEQWSWGESEAGLQAEVDGLILTWNDARKLRERRNGDRVERYDWEQGRLARIVSPEGIVDYEYGPSGRLTARTRAGYEVRWTWSCE